MADIETDGGRGTVLLPDAHRVVRALDGTEGPFAGTLVTSGDGVAVRVDAVDVAGWVGWRYAGAEHVAAPLDVIRRGGGHDVLLPWCTDRVLGFLVRRAAAGSALTPGECSTLAISLLRGLQEVGEVSEGTRSGAWWVTDGGRPVFVFGEGPDVRAGVGEILGQLREHSADKVVKRALDTVEQGLEKTASHPSLPGRLLATWEQELLNVAAPQPLDRAQHAPERAREVARAVASHDLPVSPRRRPALKPSERLRSDQCLRSDRTRSRGEKGNGGRMRAGGDVARAIGATVVARAAEIRRRTSRRPTSKGAGAGNANAPRRPRSLIVAGAVAALVLTVGLLWPGGGSPGEAADLDGVAGAPEQSAGTSAETGSPTEAAGGADSSTNSEELSAEPEESDGDRSSVDDDAPVVAASALLGVIADCRAQADHSCAGGVAAGAVGVTDALEVVANGTPTFELVDEYGDVAVVRVTASATDGDDAAGSAKSLIVVLIRTQEKWLVRDVYDVADQPG